MVGTSSSRTIGSEIAASLLFMMDGWMDGQSVSQLVRIENELGGGGVYV